MTISSFLFLLKEIFLPGLIFGQTFLNVNYSFKLLILIFIALFYGLRIFSGESRDGRQASERVNERE